MDEVLRYRYRLLHRTSRTNALLYASWSNASMVLIPSLQSLKVVNRGEVIEYYRCQVGGVFGHINIHASPIYDINFRIHNVQGAGQGGT